MNNEVIFIQGAGKDGYQADKSLADSLQTALGESYRVHYPQMPSDETRADFGWKHKIGEEISKINGSIILVGHSLGASMLLKCLSESPVSKSILGIFLIATPSWSGDEDWKQGLKLHANFADKIPKGVPIFLYQCKDDEEVPFDNLEFYTKSLPRATARTINSGGHQLNNDLSLVARDIAQLDADKS